MLLSRTAHRAGRGACPYKADDRTPEKSPEYLADVHALIASGSRKVSAERLV